MSKSTTPRAPKGLEQQVAERKARAAAEFSSYTVRKSVITGTGLDGAPVRAIVYYVSPKQPRKGETNIPIYTVTASTCCCEDSIQSRKLELDRPCKHREMVNLFHAQTKTAAPAPVPAVTPERAAQKAEHARRLSADFGDF